MAEYNLGTARGRIQLDASQVGSSTNAARQQIDALRNDLEGSSRSFHQLAGGLADLGDSIVNKLTKVAKYGALAIGGLVAASLWGGLNRVLDTEDARVQMERMGVATEDVNKILQEVDKTFTGTPFANPDGFDISTQLYASGRALDDIPGYLGSIADFAAHANVDISRMGDMFVRIASQGRVTGQELMSLAQMGIPLATLADALGMSVSEMRDMTSAGEFTADMFLEMAGNIEMFQGAAQAMGTTTRGAFANVRTALRVLGDKFLSPLFGQNGYAVQALQAIREGLRSLFPAAEAAGEAFGKWLIPAIERFIHWMKTGFVPGVQRAVELLREAAAWYKENEATIKKLIRAAAPAALILGGIATSLSLVRKALMLLKTAGPIGLIYLLVTALVYAWQNSETFRNIITAAFQAIERVIKPVVDLISHLWGVFSEGEGVIDGIIGLIGSLFGADAQNVFFGLEQTLKETWASIQEAVEPVVDWFEKHVGPIFTELGELLSAVWERFAKVTSKQWEIISTVIGVALAVIQSIWDRFGSQFIDHLTMIWTIVRSVIEVALGVIKGIIQVVTGLISGDWSKVWEGIKTTFTSVWEGMANILLGIITYIAQTVERVVGAIKAIWDRIWDDITSTASSALDSVKGVISSRWNAVAGFFSDIWDDITGAFSTAWETIAGVVQKGVDWVKGIIDQVLHNEIVQELIETLTVWRDAITNGWNAIESWFQEKLDAFRETVQETFDTVSSFLSETWAEVYGTVVEWWDAIFGFFQGIWDGMFKKTQETGDAVSGYLSSKWETISNTVKEAWGAIQDFFETVLDAIWTFFKDTWNNIFENLRKVWEGIYGIAQSIFEKVRVFLETWIGLVTSIFKAGWDFIKGIFSAAWQAIRGLIIGVLRLLRGDIDGALASVRESVTGAWNKVKEVTSRAWEAVTEAISGAVETFLSIIKAIPGNILDALGNLKDLLFDSGKAIIQGLIDGISAMAQKVKDAVSGVLQSARNLLPFSPAKEGPFSGKGWTLNSGRSIIEALAKGIKDQEQEAVKAALGVAKTVADVFTRDDISFALASSLPSPRSGGNGTSGIIGSSVSRSEIINLNGDLVLPNITDRSSAEELLDGLRQAVRKGA